MIEQKLAFRAISLAIAAALITGVSIHASKSWARPQNNSKELVDEAWQILQQDYVDGTFNHHDWQAVRQEYLNRSYSSKQQAYRAIQEIVVKLGDPYTVFFNPQEYKQFNSRTSGKLTGVGVELSENEKTKALTVVNTLKGTPAFAAGILPHDVICKSQWSRHPGNEKRGSRQAYSGSSRDSGGFHYPARRPRAVLQAY